MRLRNDAPFRHLERRLPVAAGHPVPEPHPAPPHEPHDDPHGEPGHGR